MSHGPHNKDDKRPGAPRAGGGEARVLAPGQGHTVGLLDAVPDIGTIPFDGGGSNSRRVVRLVSSAEGEDLSIELQPGRNRIGRQRVDNHIVLVSPEVSRFHAEIEVTENGIHLRDLRSANGTFVNGRQVESAMLQAGDMVGFSDDFSFLVLVDLAVESPTTMTIEAEPGGSRTEVDEASSERTEGGLLQGRPQPFAAGGGRGRRESSGVDRTREDTAGPDATLDDAIFASGESGRHVADPRISLEARTAMATPELVALERERRHLAVLYQVAKRCLEAESLAELDRLLVNVLERMVAFERGFLTYRLPSGDWKLVLSSTGYRWDRQTVRAMLHLATRERRPLLVSDSSRDGTLGRPGGRSSDARLMLPLSARDQVSGVVFLLARGAQSFSPENVNFLELFCDIAALALDKTGRLER